jgi:multisubunit Na+/H+ antiporter MnhF subunit
MIFGFGLSNNSFDGLPIDDSWLSIYQDQGIFGDVLCGAILLSLLLIAAFRPRGPTRALALFLLVYCLIASFTETGLGQASTYMLDLTIAASLLAPSAPALLDRQLVDRKLEPA